MQELLKKDKKVVWHPFTPLLGSPDPLLVTSADGVYLHTPDGRRIIDAISSWWVNLHGHAHPVIAKAISEQAATLEHVIFAGFTHEPAIKLAENLLSILPKNQSKIFYSDNGSTAVEVALKLAVQYWHNRGMEKKKVIAIKGGYHGDTFGSMSVGDRGPFTAPFSSYLFDVNYIDFPDNENTETVLQQFKTLADSEQVGAFIFEPLVQAAAGMRIYSADVLNKLVAAAQAHDIVCIADEVFTGFGRTGKLFATDYLNLSPDIIALSKGLTGGALPLGATSCSSRIAEAFQNEDFTKTFFHGHSYTANPIACAAANASFQLLNNAECFNNIARISEKHKTFLEKIGDDKIVRNVRSLGTIAAIELRSGESSYFNDLRKTIYPYFLEQNILLRPLGNVIYILPPYVINDETLDRIYECILGFLAGLK